ncbi:TonB-dependent receptor plug domain-containing protein [Flavobacterium sp. WG21]|uniref:TonB-dependent receptor plug domain-containing protein n=1 Tax=Flavobacterium sp. WG21 TaxID=1229487 RepID=UPI0009DA2A52|nr:TonB-dependent receptor plug domain-containing protein [Flavobacterium sp. WG21]
MMKNVKLASLAFSMFLCLVTHAQEKEVSHTKPVNTDSQIIICAPSKKSIINPPLVILDGVIINFKDFPKVNPNTIKEMKVLKETEAASLYGNKGINGAIIITTKENN